MITIKFNTDTAAFNDGAYGASETAAILRTLADRIEDEGTMLVNQIVIRDTNGNRVGLITAD